MGGIPKNKNSEHFTKCMRKLFIYLLRTPPNIYDENFLAKIVGS